MLAGEAIGILTAGVDTTGNVIETAAYNVISNKKIYEALRKELVEAYPDPTADMALPDLEKLPYLNGVVKEGLRLSWGVLSRFVRFVRSLNNSRNLP